MVPLWDPTDMPHSYDLIWFKIILCMFGKMEVYRSSSIANSRFWEITSLQTPVCLLTKCRRSGPMLDAIWIWLKDMWGKYGLVKVDRIMVESEFWLLSLQWSVAGLETFTFCGVLRLGMRTEMDCSFGSFGFFHGESAWSVVGCSFLKHWFWYCTKASHDPKIVCVQIFLAQAVAQQRNVSFETTSRRWSKMHFFYMDIPMIYKLVRLLLLYSI